MATKGAKKSASASDVTEAKPLSMKERSELDSQAFDRFAHDLATVLPNRDPVEHELSALQALIERLTIDETKYNVEKLTSERKEMNPADEPFIAERAEDIVAGMRRSSTLNAEVKADFNQIARFLTIVKANIEKNIDKASVLGALNLLYATLTKTTEPDLTPPLKDSKPSDSVPSKDSKPSDVASSKDSKQNDSSPPKTVMIPEPKAIVPHMSPATRFALIAFLKKTLERIKYDKTSKKEDWFLTQLTLELIAMQEDNKLTKEEVELSSQQWEQMVQAQAERLLVEQKSGGKAAGIVERVAEWQEKSPDALPYTQMAIRKMKVPYMPEKPEARERRLQRISEITGMQSRAEQLKEMALAVDMERRAKDKNVVVAKQPYEVADDIRHDMQDIGIRITTRSRGYSTGQSLGIKDFWQTEFPQRIEHEMQSDHKAREVLLKTPKMSPFPERKQTHTKELLPGLERHLKEGAKLGFLVGKVTKSEDQYVKAEGEEVLKKETDTLGKYRITPYKPRS